MKWTTVVGHSGVLSNMAMETITACSHGVVYFEALQATFDQHVAAVGGLHERSFVIGGRGVRLRMLGSLLTELLTPALAHLASPPALLPPGPTLTVSIWDDATVGRSSLAPSWSHADRLPRGEVRGHNDPTSRLLVVEQYDLGAISLLDTATDRAIFRLRAASALPAYETAAPLRTMLHWWFARQGRQLIHGGAVGGPAGGVVIVGRGGVGKSTSCLACLASPAAELRYAGDDYTLLEPGPVPQVHSLYASAKLRRDQFWRVPGLAQLGATCAGHDDQKAVLQLATTCAARLIPSFPLRALLVPQIVGGPNTSLAPLRPGQALTALAPSTILQLPGAGAIALASLAALVQQVPTYLLRLGEETAQIPQVIAAFLSSSSGQAKAAG